MATNLDPGLGLAWFPDGSRIVFPRRGRDGRGALYVVNVDTGRHRLLTRCTSRQLKDTPLCFDTEPAWSPDGSKIVFVGNDGPLYVVDAEGSGLRPITAIGKGATYPHWSPDGKTIFPRRPSILSGMRRIGDRGAELHRYSRRGR